MNIPNNVNLANDIASLDADGFYDSLVLAYGFRGFGPIDYQRMTGQFNGKYRNVTDYNHGAVTAASTYP